MLSPIANLPLSRYDFAKDRIRKLIPSLPEPLVFDVGAGDGRMRAIEAYGVRWRGFDRETWGVEEEWNLDMPPPIGERAGAVLLLDVIEHCSNPLISLKHISSALQPGGVLIHTTPNPHWSRSRITYLFRGRIWGFEEVDLVQNHHVFTPWPHILNHMLHTAGFSIEEYVTLDWRAPMAVRTTILRSALRRFVISRRRLSISAPLSREVTVLAWFVGRWGVDAVIGKGAPAYEYHSNIGKIR